MPPETHPPAATDRTDPAVDEARVLGERAGRCFDLQLRQLEARQREKRLSEAAWFGTARGEAGPEADSYEVAKLRSQVADMGEYLQAVENSLAWRTIQWLRGLVGRAW